MDTQGINILVKQKKVALSIHDISTGFIGSETIFPQVNTAETRLDRIGKEWKKVTVVGTIPVLVNGWV